MKQKIVNGRWVIWTPDSVADWDGGTGDYSIRRGWEFERFRSMQENLKYGDVLFEVGAEHGWMSGVLGREFVGAENMVLFEPSPEFWINIRKVWKYNGLNEPLGCYQGFVGALTTQEPQKGWPAAADPDADEHPSMAYRTLGANDVPATITIDDYVDATGHVPDAINIDVEGAEGIVIAGAVRTLRDYKPLVWVSVHPDLMERDFQATKEEFLEMMTQQNYVGEYLATDHEEHWLFRPVS
jgi:FkbM family methyltransferase